MVFLREMSRFKLPLSVETIKFIPKKKVSNYATLYLKKENEIISWKLWNFELLNFLFQKFCIIKKKIVTLSMGWSWVLGVGSLQMEMSQASYGLTQIYDNLQYS